MPAISKKVKAGKMVAARIRARRLAKLEAGVKQEETQLLSSFSLPKSDLFTAHQTQSQTIPTRKGKETTASSLYLESFGIYNNGEEATFNIRDISDNEKSPQMNDNNMTDPLSFETSMFKDEGDLQNDNLDFCLICGHIQTVKDAKQSASSFKWNTSGNEKHTYNSELSSDSCVDVHLLPIFVLRTLLKFPEEECVKIYKRTFGVSNPADWFTLCGRCVEAAHQAYCLSVQIRQLEKKFEACQQQFLSQIKTNVRNTENNDDLSTTHVFTVKEQILGFYSGTPTSNRNSTCSIKSGGQKMVVNKSKNHKSRKTRHIPKAQLQPDEYFEISDSEPLSEPFDADIPLQDTPEASTSFALIKSSLQKTVVNKINKSQKLGASTHAPNIFKKTRYEKAKLKRLAVRKKEDELIAEHEDPLTPNTFRCKLCPPDTDSVFKIRDDFVTHLALAHKSVCEPVPGYAQCDQCKKFFTSRSTMRYHVRKQHRTNCPHICDVCGNGYLTDKALKYHIKLHAGGGLKIPAKSLSDETAKSKRLTLKKSKDDLIAQHEDPLTPNTFLCKLCPPESDSVFDSRHGFITHLAFTHKSVWESVSDYVQCKHCGKFCSSGPVMSIHVRKHHRASFPYICHLCGNGYRTDQSLQCHIKQHDSREFRKPVKSSFVCHYCGTECVNKSGLSRHVKRFHRQSVNSSKEQSTGRAGIASQRKCKHCAIVCANFRELQLHLKSVHPELFKHKCEECDAAYISRSNLQVHVNSIHRQTKLKCKNCPKVLSTAAGMCFHLKYNCRERLNQHSTNDTN